MAFGAQFSEIKEAVRRRLGYSTHPSHAPSQLGIIEETINSVYVQQCDRVSWRHLRKWFDPKAVQAGQRFYDFPEGMGFDDILRVELHGPNGITKLTRGIKSEDLARLNPSADQRQSPPEKWQLVWNNGRPQFELWPLPERSEGNVMFRGYVATPKLVNEGDICLIDDELVVLYATAELGPSEKKKILAAQAKDRANVLRAKQANGDPDIDMRG